MRAVGSPVSHESARAHVTGGAKYVDDLWPQRAGTAHLWPVTVPFAHARVRGLDATAALEAPGVLGVLTAEDVPGENDIGPARRDEPLFPEEVCFHGQPVAWVVGETEEQARLGATRVSVDCEELEAIIGIDAALAADSFHCDTEKIAQGDAAAELARAPHRLSGRVDVGGQEHFYLETQAALAYIDESGELVVQSSTQHPAETQELVARVMGLPRNLVVVQC